MGNPNKDNKGQGDTEGTSADSITSPWDAHHANRDLSREREARDATLAKQVAEAVARDMAKADVHYQALLNERSAAVIPTSLKVTSGGNGLRLWTPLTGPRTRLSTRDGKCGQRRLDMPLMLWKVTQKGPKFHISTTGYMAKE